jgi:uncharacterized membrane-anchored protein
MPVMRASSRSAEKTEETGNDAGLGTSRRGVSGGLRASSGKAGAITGPARLGKRTKELTQRLAPNSIAVLDHPDLDAVAARALLACRPLAVINVQPFVTGRYPNRGPSLLVDAGIPLFEAIPTEAQSSLFQLLNDGETVTLEEGCLWNVQGKAVADLDALPSDLLIERLTAARGNLDAELSQFAENTLRYLARDEERALLLDPVEVPEVKAKMAGRPVLIVVRGESYEDDLRQLAPYIKEQRPVVVAVDGAADTLLAGGVRPDIILGDMDSVSDATLRCGAELIVHAYVRSDGTTGNAPGMARVEGLGLTAKPFPVRGTSEDAALLMAYEKGADLIVAVGTHTNLEDFLDKGRGGMASTFLVRLKVGSRLVDARGVSRLYTTRAPMGPLLFFLGLSALFPIIVLAASTPQGQVMWRSFVVWFRLLFR